MSILKVEPSKKRKLEMLIKLTQSVFGINAKIDFSKWKMEQDKIIIRDIDFDEDLLTVLQRLREYFYINIETETETYTIPNTRKKTVSAVLVIELILRE